MNDFHLACLGHCATQPVHGVPRVEELTSIVNICHGNTSKPSAPWCRYRGICASVVNSQVRITPKRHVDFDMKLKPVRVYGQERQPCRALWRHGTGSELAPVKDCGLIGPGCLVRARRLFIRARYADSTSLFCTRLPTTTHIQRHGSHLHDDGVHLTWARRRGSLHWSSHNCTSTYRFVCSVWYRFKLRDVASAATGQVVVALHQDKHGLADHLTSRMGATAAQASAPPLIST